MAITATLVCYYNELYMCDLQSKPLTLYKSWQNLIAHSRGLVPSNPHLIHTLHVLSDASRTSQRVLIAWSDDEAIPRQIRVLPVFHTKDQSLCAKFTADILHLACDTSFKEGSEIYIGIRAPRKMLKQHFTSDTRTPHFIFTHKPCKYDYGLNFLLSDDNIVSKLVCIGWLNTRSMCYTHAELCSAKILYMPHSVSLPSAKIALENI